MAIFPTTPAGRFIYNQARNSYVLNLAKTDEPTVGIGPFTIPLFTQTTASPWVLGRGYPASMPGSVSSYADIFGTEAISGGRRIVVKARASLLNARRQQYYQGRTAYAHIADVPVPQV